MLGSNLTEMLQETPLLESAMFSNQRKRVSFGEADDMPNLEPSLMGFEVGTEKQQQQLGASPVQMTKKLTAGHGACLDLSSVIQAATSGSHRGVNMAEDKANVRLLIDRAIDDPILLDMIERDISIQQKRHYRKLSNVPERWTQLGEEMLDRLRFKHRKG